MRVIGTAGHVDHGKSTLVKALTGINPDRLAEEQKREMTIELGFAWMTLSNGEQVGIVDVPGHRDFIENMLAGVGGIDAVIFVIAADEGIMPQTMEHLAILDILKIYNGVIALTKCDLVEPDWIEMMKEEIRQFLQGTMISKAKIVPVSAKTGFGLEVLKKELSDILVKIPERRNTGHPRLPIDRVFTIAGFGTVVTGTLIDGTLRTGSEIEILPEEIKGRIRGLQTHKMKEDTAFPGSRCAVNISGVDVNAIKRGDVLAEQGYFRPTNRFDVSLDVIRDASAPIRHGDEIKIFSGTAETIVRIRLIGAEAINPGEHGWAQIETSSHLVLVQGDRFVIRRPSPGETIGGGVVDNPHPVKRYKRFDESAINQFELAEQGSETDQIINILNLNGIMTFDTLSDKSGLEKQAFKNLIRKMRQDGTVLVLSKNTDDASPNVPLTSLDYWTQKKNALLQLLNDFHSMNSLKKGMSMEEAKNKLGIDQKQFTLLVENLISKKEIGQLGSVIFRFDHEINLSPTMQKKVDDLLKLFKENPKAPPSVKESIDKVGMELFEILKDRGDLVQISDDVVFSKEFLENQINGLLRYFSKNDHITVAEYRDLAATSRKYALAFLEYCDSLKITSRNGDFRILAKRGS